MNEKKVLYKLYAQPLLNRKDKSSSAICREYYTDLFQYKDLRYQEEAQIWLLLSYLHDELLEIPDFFKPIITKNPKLEPYIRYYLWLDKIYDFTRKSDEKEYSLFEYFRSGDNNQFLEKVKLRSESEGWNSLTFTGAFSSNHFKQWRETVYAIKERKGAIKDINLYLALAGDKGANKKYEKNIFDKIWTQIYSIICLAASNQQYSFRFGNLSLNEDSQFETMAFSIFKNITNDIETLCLNSTYPLIFRVHVAATFNKLSIGLLQTYIGGLVSERLIGLIIFYTSLASPENSKYLLADVLLTLEPSESLVDVIRAFGIDETDLVCQIVERLSHTTIEDFEGEISENEITDVKIKCLEWLSLVPSLKERALINVRKILCSLILQNAFEGALKVFNKFSKLFDSKKEFNCWQIYICCELEYMKWSESDQTNYPKSSLNDLRKTLTNIICFPGGWMVDCPNVDIIIGKHCIPRVIEHLFNVCIVSNESQEGMGIPIHIWRNFIHIQKYLNDDDLKHFIYLSAKSVSKCSRKQYRTKLSK